MGKNLVSQRDFLTERGAWELRGIIEANSRYKAVFRVEKSDYGLFVIRSNLLRGLERKDEKQGVLPPRGNVQQEANGGAGREVGGKVLDGGA